MKTRSKPPFRFQQFVVDDRRVSMKVGTDGVMLGAWAPIQSAKRILDVGTGCGIIALMVAQRTAESNARISAIDIDHAAAVQAVENFQSSPWADRLPCNPDEVHFSLERFGEVHNETRFDLIVCNPPYFESTYRSPNESRNVVRQIDHLSRHSLFQESEKLLSENGRLCLVLPWQHCESAISIALANRLFLRTQVNVRPKTDAMFKRVLLEFGKSRREEVHVSELVIESKRHQHSPQYSKLVRDFYLRYKSPSGN